MTDETYQGSANRETWAFNLHWQNDQGLYSWVLEQAAAFLEEHSDASDRRLGEAVVEYVEDDFAQYDDEGITPPQAVAMMRREVGSFWRIDRAEVGAAARESLEVES